MSITTTIPTITAYGGTIPDRSAGQTEEQFASNVYPFLLFYNDSFIDDVLAYSTAMNSFKTEANALETNVNEKEASAVAAAAAAFLTANVTVWVSGTTYAIGDNVLSPINFKTYVRKTNGAGTTDPSADSANYDLKTAPDTTKLPLTGGTMTGAITSLRETSVAMGANNIDLATGNLFTKTITTATTLTVSNVPTSGTVGYFILQLTNGGAGAITWFSGVKWAGGTAPTLTASGKDILSFYTIDAGTTWNVVSIQKDVK